MTDHNRQEQTTATSAVDSRVLEEVSKALAGLRFGSVEITVHDGKVTQIEAKKKIRLS
ncbi:MAG TPA: YezD family protein [Pseudomonadales bacterium]|nr:YezD family protein [Pseudomonadales bacterium]